MSGKTLLTALLVVAALAVAGAAGARAATGEGAPAETEEAESVAARPRPGEPDRAAWERVLARFARSGGLDYAGLQAEPADLESYLASLAQARPDDWPVAQQIAFWCNAYNAVVAHFVLERYPGITSVKAVDGFFDRFRFPVAGAERTLDEIETAARDLGDPRVHFAVVCASTSCPDLQEVPFRGADLDRQLEVATRMFLADPTKGLRYDADANTLYLSSIFKWYAGDFTGGSTVVAFFARSKVLGWVLEHLPEELAARLREREPGVRYLEYDWTLNDRAGG